MKAHYLIFMTVLFTLCLFPKSVFCKFLSRDSNIRFNDIHLDKGEAAVWYLYHSGWAVKTSQALILFDYWERSEKLNTPSLFNGYVNPEEIKDQNVFVFISHRHGDHFDETVLEWDHVIPRITYVFGWPAPEAKEHIFFGQERSSRSKGPLTVHNIYHDFDGIPESAFLIEVDGLTIYFSGDHGNSPGRLHPVYKNNIDYISQKGPSPDLIFLSIFGSPTFEGELYAIEKFTPKVMLPMHYGAREDEAEQFIRLARIKFPGIKFEYPLEQGDAFLYKKGNFQPLK